MRSSPLPTPWNLYNLEGSPYFQNTLETSEHSAAPLSLFVGRQVELQDIRSSIHGTDRHGSRQAIAGIPGVGKTTLAQAVKSVLLEDGYLTTDSFVPILPNDTPEALFGRVLGMLYDTILANRPATLNNQAMQDAQVLVRASRLTARGGSISLAGFGVGASTSISPSAPTDLMIDGPRVMRDLMNMVRSSDGRGVVVHVNNLESLSEADAVEGAEVLRGLRDPMLLHEGLHLIFVGTTDAVNITLNTHTQVRSIFRVIPLEPLNISDVHGLLEARYNHLKKAPGKAVVPPAEKAAVDTLYALYRGDLRGMLKALEDGVSPLLGLTGTGTAEAAGEVRPITEEEIRTVLQERYAQQLSSLPEQTRVDQLVTWGQHDPNSIQTQQSLMDLWGVSQGAVSAALKYMVQQGFVVPLPREGRGAIRYILSGTGRIIFGGRPSFPPTPAALPLRGRGARTR